MLSQLAGRCAQATGVEPIEVVAQQHVSSQPFGGRKPEGAVGAGEVVAEFDQLGLQLGDIVTGEQLAGFVGEYPVAQLPVRPRRQLLRAPAQECAPDRSRAP